MHQTRNKLAKWRRINTFAMGSIVKMLLFGVYASGQSSLINNMTSVPVPGAGHAYIADLNEVVNPANGSVSVRIEAQRPRERGLNFPLYSFLYDSNTQYIVQLQPSYFTGDQCAPGQNPAAGGFPTRCVQSVLGPALGQPDPTILKNPGPNSMVYGNQSFSYEYSTSRTVSCSIRTGFIYEDPYGVRHSLNLVSTSDSANNAPCASTFSTEPILGAGDEEYKALASDVGTGTQSDRIIDLHGNSGPLTPSGFSNFIPLEDTNGNFQNTSGRSGDFNGFSTANYYTSNMHGSTTQTYPGNSQPYTYTWSQVNIQFDIKAVDVTNLYTGTNDNLCSGGTNPIFSANSVVTSMERPDKLSYGFTYDPTYGLLSKITYPTGAWVQYTWGRNPSSEMTEWHVLGNNMESIYIPPGGNKNSQCWFRHDFPAITKRIVSYDGTNQALEQDFCYRTTWSASDIQDSCSQSVSPTSTNSQWQSKTTTVTTIDLLSAGHPSYVTVYNYIPFPADPGFASNIATSGIPVEDTITYKDTSGITLRTVKKIWNTPNQLAAECEILPSGQVSGKFYAYAPYSFGTTAFIPTDRYSRLTNDVTDLSEYDYGTVSANCVKPTTTPAREIVTAYASFANSPLWPSTIYYQGNSSIPVTPQNMVDRPSSVKVYDHGTLISENDYGYDESSVSSVSSALVANTHDPNYGSNSSVPRGNLTSVIKKCVHNCTTNSKTTYTYDETGQTVSATDPCGNVACSDMSGTGHTINYYYSDNYSTDNGAPSANTNIYLTKVVNPSVNNVQITRTYQYGFNDGNLRSTTDVNNNSSTTYCYYMNGCGGSSFDPWLRLTEIDYSDGGRTNISYQDAGPQPNMTLTTAQSASGTPAPVVRKTTYDAYGHAIEAQTISDPAGTDIVDTTYDGLGRVHTVSNPYRSTSDLTYGNTTYVYDALGRVTKQVQADGTSTIQWCYNGLATNGQNNCLTNQSTYPNESWVDFADESGRRLQRVSDALGRLTAVREPDGSTNITATPTLETDYSYDALDDLTQVNQHGLTRSFTYDSLSRLITASNPESGTTCYGVVSGSSCVNGYDANGNLIAKTDARGIRTTYTYDALNRLTAKTYSDGATPSVFYGYDEPGVTFANGPIAVTNGIGRMTSEGVGTPASFTWKALRSYDPMGRILNYRIYWNDGGGNGAPGFPRQYDLAGNMTKWDNGAGRSFSQTFDAAGHATSLTTNPNGSPIDATLISNVSYRPAGEFAAVLGNGSESRRYYDNRLRVNSYRLAITPGAYSYLDAWDVTYDTNGNVTHYSDNYEQGIWTNTYDNLNRLITADSTWGPGCQYSYDTLGNRLSQGPHSGGTCFNSGYTYSNNRISTPGFQYDAAGNLTSDGTNLYSYDAENRLIGFQGGGTTATYKYDPEGYRTDAIVNGVGTKYGYDSDGRLMWTNYGYGKGEPDDVYFNGRHFGYIVLNANGSLSSVTYSSVNWLGTELARFDSNKNLVGKFNHLPFGDGQTVFSGVDNDTLHFTGKERDQATGLDYFGARYYASTMGRLLSPDPEEATPLHLLNPQRWNKYSYGLNNPLSYTDSGGRDAAAVNFSKEIAIVGHEGVMSVTSDGTVRYARFGPVGGSRPMGEGQVQSFTLNTKIQFDSNGNPTQDSLNAVKQELGTSDNSPEKGQDPSSIRLNYFKTTDQETANLNQWIDQQQAASDQHKSPRYNVLTNNCANFCLRGLVAGDALTQSQANHMSFVPNILWYDLSQFQSQEPKATVTTTECDTLPDGSQRCY